MKRDRVCVGLLACSLFVGMACSACELPEPPAEPEPTIPAKNTVVTEEVWRSTLALDPIKATMTGRRTAGEAGIMTVKYDETRDVVEMYSLQGGVHRWKVAGRTQTGVMGYSREGDGAWEPLTLSEAEYAVQFVAAGELIADYCAMFIDRYADFTHSGGLYRATDLQFDTFMIQSVAIGFENGAFKTLTMTEPVALSPSPDTPEGGEGVVPTPDAPEGGEGVVPTPDDTTGAGNGGVGGTANGSAGRATTGGMQIVIENGIADITFPPA